MNIEMKSFNIIIMVSAAALLSGCGIYGKYERPEVDAAGIVRDVTSNTDTLAVTDTRQASATCHGRACSQTRRCSRS